MTKDRGGYDLSSFDTSNVTCMNSMFLEAGYSNSSFRLDCSNWNVDKVTVHTDFNKNVTSKIIESQWKN